MDTMDTALWKAATEGDVKFLKEAVDVQPPKYFLAHFKDVGNIFHRAASKGNVEFLKEAMEILPADILKQLLHTTDVSKYTVIHIAAVNNNIMVAKIIKKMYASLSWHDDKDHKKPWLTLTLGGKTPLNLALGHQEANEIIAMEILSLDTELVSCTIPDYNGNTPLYYAIDRGFDRVAENILMSPHPSNTLFTSNDFLSLVIFATKCSGDVVRGLLQKSGALDNDGNTTLHSALRSKSPSRALETLATYPAMRKTRNNKGESPFFIAVKSSCEEVVNVIMKIEEPRYQMLRRNDGKTVLHRLSCCSEKTGKKLLEKFWWMYNLRDDQEKTALDYAKRAKALWLVTLLSKPSLIEKEEFDWIEACKRQENAAVLAFVETCEDLQKACRLKNDSPLHHIKPYNYKECLKLLKNPSITELKNMIDKNGATALHCALKRKDIDFAKALLLDDEVQKTIEDDHDKTAMDLLAKLCKDHPEWDNMCKEIKVNPQLKTSYIQAGTNLDQIRNTLSVVAALLATITFAAGFTLPGGLNSDSGEALLARKAGFLVFLLADVYAMCTSMLVLFSLIWSMVSETDMARLLVDRSVFLLMQSLYATLLAFIAGIYTVIARSSLWAAILIFVMCSIIGISANRSILHKVIAKLVPAAAKEKKRSKSRFNNLTLHKVMAKLIPAAYGEKKDKTQEVGAEELREIKISKGDEKKAE